MKKSDREYYIDCLAFAVRLIEKSPIVGYNHPNQKDLGDHVIALADKFYTKVWGKDNGL